MDTVQDFAAVAKVTLPSGATLLWDMLAKTATIQARHPGAKPEVYAVQETPCAGGRSFIFTKADGTFYRVIVTRDGFGSECSCRGYMG
jgi:hypothetical protein